MSTKDKWVRRFSVDETAKHKNGFTIYKITSVLFPLDSPEAVTVVSVWKRYSDVQRLHRSMRALHSGLHLRGNFPILPKNSYFKRFQQEVIEERAKSIKTLLEFVAEHQLLFTSTDFVNFLQTGYPEPAPKGSVINAIRSSLHLPIEEKPPLEYQTSDDDARSPTHSARTPLEAESTVYEAVDVSRIPIYEAADVEIRSTHVASSSYESIPSIGSVDSDFYEELRHVTVAGAKTSVKRLNVLPDLINFDAPTASGSTFEDYHTMCLASPSSVGRMKGIDSSEATASFDNYQAKGLSLSHSNTVREKGIDNSEVPQRFDDYNKKGLSLSPSNTMRGKEIDSSEATASFDVYHTKGLSLYPSNTVRVKGIDSSEATASFDNYRTKGLSLSPSNTVRGKEIDSTDAVGVRETEHRDVSRSISFDGYCTSDLASSPSSGVRVKEMENSYVFESPLYDGTALSEREIEDVCESGTDCVSEGGSLCSAVSLSSVVRAKETEDSYVFEAGYLLAMAARCEDKGQYRRAFHCYRAGIEKMLIGVRSDTDPQRRTIIKQKISKYLSYAETIYKNHLCDTDDNQLLSEPEEAESLALCPPPISMLRRPYEDLSSYRVLDVLGPSVMLVLHRTEQTCYAMKVIRKIPHNLTEFDEYFMQRTNETRQPILPTLIPYMVPLHAYIETNSLIFLILSYAPGKKLFDYIKDYAKSLPSTPNREVNLENVFTEPSKRNNIDMVNDNIDEVDSAPNIDSEIANSRQDPNKNIDANIDDSAKVGNSELLDNAELSTSELVVISQKLLRNVDRALTEIPNLGAIKEEVGSKKVERENLRKEAGKLNNSSLINRALPSSAARCWAAQLLAAIDGLHNCGVICRDLSPRNILLGDKGQIILTYFVFYPGLDMALTRVRPKGSGANMYLAPELYQEVYLDPERDECLEKVCDFWSYGAILYELLCGVPLSSRHRGIFNSHTILQLPDGLPLEVQSLLTQGKEIDHLISLRDERSTEPSTLCVILCCYGQA